MAIGIRRDERMAKIHAGRFLGDPKATFFPIRKCCCNCGSIFHSERDFTAASCGNCGSSACVMRALRAALGARASEAEQEGVAGAFAGR